MFSKWTNRECLSRNEETHSEEYCGRFGNTRFPSSSGLRLSTSRCVLSTTTPFRTSAPHFANLVGQTERPLVDWVVVDNTCRALHTSLVQDFPLLRGVAWDTCHLLMKYESSPHNRRSPGSTLLRRFLVSFNSPDTLGVVRELPVLYKGTACHTEDTTEAMCREHFAAVHCRWLTR